MFQVLFFKKYTQYPLKMDKTWFDDETWKMESSTSEKENIDLNKTNSNIKLPFCEAFLLFVQREVKKVPDSNYSQIIKAIEIVVGTNPANLHEALVINLQPFLNEQTQPIVSKLMLFKKRVCRDGPNCTRLDKCIFMHPNQNDQKNTKKRKNDVFTNSYTSNFNSDNSSASNNKRFKEEEKQTEVIFNRVPEQFDFRQIREYASKFGTVKEVKSLKEDKFLIKFRHADDAKNLVLSKDIVLGDPQIKKFFNKYCRRTTEEDLIDLFDQQGDYLQKLIATGDNKDLLSKLIWITNRIKSVVIPKNAQKDNLKKNHILTIKIILIMSKIIEETTIRIIATIIMVIIKIKEKKTITLKMVIKGIIKKIHCIVPVNF
ncbi:hypothetical protein EDEG_01779 [Edhazardia aedis USNM 41457]|uniref:C3H1-type domain-containing protein n=1 Tax=Edhazardia aedis (strain USNM 41457) TaxID=1003232 RepID=J8ZW57_EDHAE|nr:hypothetical protein EDEG_01779 [Edhazardia aedis USNM 41457]|eukprot:EJW03923.1 hypothetical protein EDEG_01779 [Edhazardia aedis USNM 41457]